MSSISPTIALSIDYAVKDTDKKNKTYVLFFNSGGKQIGRVRCYNQQDSKQIIQEAQQLQKYLFKRLKIEYS